MAELMNPGLRHDRRLRCWTKLRRRSRSAYRRPGSVGRRHRPQTDRLRDERTLPVGNNSKFVHLARHEQFADKLLDVIQTDTQHDLVAVEQDHRAWLLHGPQGSGKTYFVEQHLRAAAKARAIPLIRLNAFEHDFEDEPLLGMAGAIAQEVDIENSATATALGARALDWAASNAQLMGKAIGIATGSVAGSSPIGAAIGEQAGRTLGDWWKKSPLSAFQRELKKAVGVLTEPSGGQGTTEDDTTQARRCVLVIDDLDRCRPTFALRLLERALHVFPVDGLAVLIVSDRKVLENVAQREYGISSERYYMDKFFRASFVFEPVDPHTAFLAWFADYAMADVIWGEGQKNLASLFGSVARSKSLTLRQVSEGAEHAYRYCDWSVLRAYDWVVLASIWLMATFPQGQACIEALRRGESSCEEVLSCLSVSDDGVREQWEKAFEDRENLRHNVNRAFDINLP